MVLAHARVARSAVNTDGQNLEIRRGRVFFRDAVPADRAIDLRGYLVLPGLINAHDHLEFSLFPRLGRRLYANATEWAADIYRPVESPVREHRSLARRDRMIWGGLRNLLSGITTVAHHNPYHAELFNSAFPVRVIRRFGWAHSLAFSPDLLLRYRATRPELPFIIHAAEGTDDCSHSEIRALDRMGILSSRTVIAHGIALDSAGLETIRKRRTPVIWCPSSNLLTYGRTLAYHAVRETTRVTLGTDSAISAAGDMADELRTAHSHGAPAEDLYEMLTTGAAAILRLGRAGAIDDGAIADLVVVADRGQRPADVMLNLLPEMVILQGRLKLVSTRLATRLDSRLTSGFQPVSLEGRGAWLVPFDIARLLRDARAAVGPEIRLAGKRVWQ